MQIIENKLKYNCMTDRAASKTFQNTRNAYWQYVVAVTVNISF